MSRHSLNQTDRPFFTYEEKKAMGWGSLNQRIGEESQLPFGVCCLSLKPPEEPVASPQGYVFDKRTILEYLLNEKLKIRQKKKERENKERRSKRKAAEMVASGEAEKLEKFKRFNDSLDSSVKVELEEKKTALSSDKSLLKMDKNEALRSSFWVQDELQKSEINEEASRIEKEESCPRCPMSGKKLRLKDLIPIKFELSDETAKFNPVESGNSASYIKDKGRFCCSLSKRPITHQEAVLIKPSGIVILKSVFENLVKKKMKCPLTDVELKEGDVIELQRGGTGFCGHSKVEIKVGGGVRSMLNEGGTRGLRLAK